MQYLTSRGSLQGLTGRQPEIDMMLIEWFERRGLLDYVERPGQLVGGRVVDSQFAAASPWSGLDSLMRIPRVWHIRHASEILAEYSFDPFRYRPPSRRNMDLFEKVLAEGKRAVASQGGGYILPTCRLQ